MSAAQILLSTERRSRMTTLRKLRIKSGLSSTEMARLVHAEGLASEKTYFRYESGKQIPKLETLRGIILILKPKLELTREEITNQVFWQEPEPQPNTPNKSSRKGE